MDHLLRGILSPPFLFFFSPPWLFSDRTEGPSIFQRSFFFSPFLIDRYWKHSQPPPPFPLPDPIPTMPVRQLFSPSWFDPPKFEGERAASSAFLPSLPPGTIHDLSPPPPLRFREKTKFSFSLSPVGIGRDVWKGDFFFPFPPFCA